MDDSGCFLVFDRTACAVLIVEPNVDLRDMHGIASIQNSLWVTCTYDNAIAVMQDDQIVFHYPLGRPDGSPYDFNHINTIVERPEGIYILAHNLGRTESEVVLLDSHSLKILSRQYIGYMAHNIWFDGVNLRVCSSGTGTVIGSDGLKVEIGHFPRGYTENDEIRVIGISVECATADRDIQPSSVAVLDLNYDILEVIDLGNHGMVLDIAEISDEECAFLLRLGARSPA